MIKYIILTILVILTILNIYSFTFGRKQKKKNAKQLEILRNSLEKKSVKILKSNKVKTSSKHFFVSDINEGFLLIFDNQNKLFMVITETGTEKFYCKDVLECKTEIYKEDKYLLSSETIVKTESGDTEFVFGSVKRKSKSIFGQFIVDTTHQFTNLINTFLKENS